jgi:hypothetical protein
VFAVKAEQIFRIDGSKFMLFDAYTCNMAPAARAIRREIEAHMQMFTIRRPI